jgi:hypothetical protein
VPNTLVKLEEDIPKYIFGLVDCRSWGGSMSVIFTAKLEAFLIVFSFRENAEYQQKSL